MSNSRSRKSRQRGYEGIVHSSRSSNFNESGGRNSCSEEGDRYRVKLHDKQKNVTYGSPNERSYLVRNQKGMHRDIISGSSSNSPSCSSHESSYRKGQTKYRSQEKVSEYQNQEDGDKSKRMKTRLNARADSDGYESSQGRGGKQRSSSLSM